MPKTKELDEEIRKAMPNENTWGKSRGLFSVKSSSSWFPGQRQ